jgi:hypothetical protein
MSVWLQMGKNLTQNPLHTNKYEGFEVLTAMVVKSTIFWDITLCRPSKVNRRFERTYNLHLLGRRISRARKQVESRVMLVSCSAYSLTLKMEAIYSFETSTDF